jgi:hypothetical protein
VLQRLELRADLRVLPVRRDRAYEEGESAPHVGVLELSQRVEMVKRTANAGLREGRSGRVARTLSTPQWEAVRRYT